MEISELGKTPIRSEQPSGEDVRYEPEFEALQSEIDKSTSLTAANPTDWDNVVRLSTTILSEKSKNLLVASYLCAGLIKINGLEGLAAAINMYRSLLEQFWDTLFPPQKRMKGRLNALEWWLEKVLDGIESLPTGITLDKSAKDALLDDVNAIDAFLAEKLDDAPLLHELKSRIAAIVVPAESPVSMAQSVDSKASRSPQSVTPQTVPASREIGQALEDVADHPPQKVMRRGLDMLRQAAAIMRQADPADARAYRLNRMAAWTGIEKLPPADRNGTTRIEPPMKEYISVLEQLYQQDSFSELLESAEGRVGQYLFWLDLSRYTAEALENLGHDPARQAVADHTARFVRRFRGIEKLTFSDGTPFADFATAQWLEDIIKRRLADTDNEATKDNGGYSTADSAAVEDCDAQARQ